MKYAIDTEFIDDGKTIDLISIGIVAEDGRELYLQSREYDPNNGSQWVYDNVIRHLHSCPEGLMHPFRCIDEEFNTINPRCPWLTRSEIKQKILTFLDPEKYGKPDLYGWCSAYDYVVFCQIFGTMMDLPSGYPHYIRDLQQLLDERHISDDQLPPQGQGKHNALIDARYIRDLWTTYHRTFGVNI